MRENTIRLVLLLVAVLFLAAMSLEASIHNAPQVASTIAGLLAALVAMIRLLIKDPPIPI
jgi:hypothetical protein